MADTNAKPKLSISGQKMQRMPTRHELMHAVSVMREVTMTQAQAIDALSARVSRLEGKPHQLTPAGIILPSSGGH